MEPLKELVWVCGTSSDQKLPTGTVPVQSCMVWEAHQVCHQGMPWRCDLCWNQSPWQLMNLGNMCEQRRDAEKNQKEGTLGC